MNNQNPEQNNKEWTPEMAMNIGFVFVVQGCAAFYAAFMYAKESALIGYSIGAILLLLAGVCFTQGKARKLLASITGIVVFLLTLYYAVISNINGGFGGFASVISFMLIILLGFPGIAVAVLSKFGLQDNEPE